MCLQTLSSIFSQLCNFVISHVFLGSCYWDLSSQTCGHCVHWDFSQGSYALKVNGYRIIGPIINSLIHSTHHQVCTGPSVFWRQQRQMARPKPLHRVPCTRVTKTVQLIYLQMAQLQALAVEVAEWLVVVVPALELQLCHRMETAVPEPLGLK